MGALISSEATTILTELLAQARIAIRRDPAAADDWLSRFERILRQGQRTGGLAPWQATRVQRHVEAHIGERLHTAELAAIVRLSENHFARAFKTTMGTPPHAYVLQRRIHHARALILETQLPGVGAICSAAEKTSWTRPAGSHVAFRQAAAVLQDVDVVLPDVLTGC